MARPLHIAGSLMRIDPRHPTLATLVALVGLGAGCSSTLDPEPPTALPYDVHAMAVADFRTLIVRSSGDAARPAGTVETDGDPVVEPTYDEDGAAIPIDLPLATAVAAGDGHACILSGTQVYCWGDQEYGALGEHRACSTGDSATCVLQPAVMPTLPAIRAIAAGDRMTCAVSEDDEVFCWGDASQGRLGGSRVASLDPPTAVALPTRPARLLVQYGTACVLDHAASAWCWGAGYGAVPQQLELAGVLDLAIGRHHTCAITTARGLECWGENRNGQCGDAAFARKCGTTTPACTIGPTSLGLDATRVVVGERHSCALLRDTRVACWGSNEVGQLGRDNAFLVGEVELVLDGAVDLAASYARTCALRHDRSAWCWGEHDDVEL